MDSRSKMDLSLDEIIKLNRKNKIVKTVNRGKARASTIQNVRQGRLSRASALRPNLARPMKSRQNSTALAIFRRARQTASVAAKVAADAAAMLAPRNPNNRKFDFFKAKNFHITRNNRTRNQPVASRGRNNGIIAKKDQMQPVIRRQQRQRLIDRVRANPPVLQRNNHRNQLTLVNRAFNQPRNQHALFIHQRNNFGNQSRGMQRPSKNMNMRLTSSFRPQQRQFNLQNYNLQAQRNQQYLAQARALILARQEINQMQPRSRGRFNGRR